MACDNLSNTNADSEMEEGEIVDELDELSDISSEEEFLLRQRLQVLENYNNVLERKEAKRTSIGSGNNHRRVKAFYDHSQISGTDADDGFSKLKYRITKEHRPNRLPKQKKIKQIDGIRYKDSKKKVQRKKKLDTKNKSDTSDYSDDEYRNKRKKLADAVSFNKVKSDTSTLKDRINKMLCVSKSENHIINIENKNDEDINMNNNIRSHEVVKEDNVKVCKEISNDTKSCQLIDLCNDANIVSIPSGIDTVDSITVENNVEGNSDEDLELLRQHALKTKSKTLEKVVIAKEASENKSNLSDEEDSDTAELRLICLKSALLKKAIEMKRKQKLQKKRFQNVQNHSDVNTSDGEVNIDNNTDVESVDMDIGSDVEDKGKSLITECDDEGSNQNILEDNSYRKKGYKDDELEEDEDLLRAKLLTSLSKNLPNLLNLNMFNSKSDENTGNNIDTAKDLKDNIKDIKDDGSNIEVNEPPPVAAEEKKFIIHLGESDSEGEHEATKNLTKMHIKLAEQAEFQLKLDNLLKTVRNKTEETTLPDVVQKPVKPLQKIVAKAMNHLPKSEQIEYRNLVKRMAELEKIKQARKISSNGNNKMTKETLKPRNVSIDSKKSVVTKNIDEKIALSRKKIAEESSKIINLKEESKKLAQRYKIVATELRNITTAITINKKQQKSVQDGLSKIRLQHQMLLQGTNRHSNLLTRINNKVMASKLQKENNPTKDDHKNSNNLKCLKVSVVNDFNKEITHPRLSVQVDINTNKKNVKLPKSPIKERIVDFKEERLDEATINETEDLGSDDVSRLKCEEIYNKKDISDYVSPLDALESKNWKGDPNAVLCPFEVGGSCRDPDCKYLHPEIPTQK